MRKFFFWLCFLVFMLQGHGLYAWQEEDFTEDSLSNTQEEEVVQLREITAAHWNKIQHDKGFIYSKPKPPKVVKQINMGWLKAISPIVKILLYVLVALCIGVILYSLLRNSEFNYFRKERKKESFVQGEEEDLPSFQDWEKAMEDAIAKKNFRLAVRLLYLQTLHILDQQQLIFYKQDKTNWDYVYQLKTTPYSERFTQLTKYFDYVWYGHFVIDEQGFKQLNETFRTFQKEVHL